MATNEDMNVDQENDGMMKVILKTLDGQNKEFVLSKEITVIDFKNEISKSLNIPPPQQRLIFQGKVLQDTKQLQEYSVADKVVHLVPRAPPSANTGSASSSPRNRARSERSEESGDVTDITAVQTMVESILSSMGEFGQRADVTAQPDGSGFDILVNINPQSHRMSLARIRQLYLQRIEEQVRALLHYLADPVNNPMPNPDYQVLRQESPFQTINVQNSGGENSGSTTSNGRSTESSTTNTTPEGRGASVPQSGASNDPLPITALADMMDRVRGLYADAEPYIIRWQSILREDADLGEGAEEAQKFYDTVNRVLHLLSHMMHNISDFIVELGNGSQRPRHLLVLSETPVQSVQTRIHIDSAADVPPFRLGRRPASIDRSRLSRSSTATTNIPAASPQTGSNDSQTAQPSSDSPATGDPPHRRSLSATRVGSTPATFRSELGRGMIARSRPNNAFNRIQTSDGGVYVTASTQPQTFVEMRPHALSVNSMSAHIVAAAVDLDQESAGRSSTNQQSGTDNSAGENSPTPGRDNNPVIGMPRELLQQVLESALRNSFEMTDIGSDNNTTRENAQTPGSGRRGAASSGNIRRTSRSFNVNSGGAASTGSAPASAGNSLGSVLRGSLHPGHSLHPSCGVDPYLPCHSRHYMDHESVSEGLEGRRLAMGHIRRGAVPESADGSAASTGSETPGSGANRVIREVHMFPILPRTSNFSATFSNAAAANSSSGAPTVNIRNNMEAMSSVLTAMLGGAMTPGSTAHSGRTGTSTTNTATTGNAGNTSTTTGSSASSNGSSGLGGSLDFNTLQNMMTAMMGALNPNQTEGNTARLSEFFSQLTGSSLMEESPTSLLGDASNLLLNEWSTSDVISLVFLHDRRPLDRLRTSLQNLIATRERESNREKVIEDIILDCRQIYTPSTDSEEFGDIDVGESVAALFRHHLTQLLSLISDSPTDTGFGGLVIAHLTHLCEEAIILFQLICNDDEARLESLLQQIFDSWANSFMREQQNIRATATDFSMLYRWMSSMLRGNTAHMMSHEIENLRRNVSRFIVHKTVATSAEANDQTSTIESAQTKKSGSDEGEAANVEMDSSEFGTPPESSSPRAGSDVSFSETAAYLIDCMPTADDLPENPLAPHPDITFPMTKSNAEGSLTSEEPEAMDTSGNGSSPEWNEGTGGASAAECSAEGWHAVLPHEWVHVVARDVDTQRQSLNRSLTSFTQSHDPAADNNTTLSDAYLAGMPAKRRKLMLAAKEVILQPANLLLGDCVHEAVRQSGVSSSSTQSSSHVSSGVTATSSDVNTIAADSPLSQAFKDYVTEKMGQRLEQDQDYLPELFPDSERVFRGRNKTARKSPSAFNEHSKLK